ncbi:unnamed protein product [Gadus morhua 'NCC']
MVLGRFAEVFRCWGVGRGVTDMDSLAFSSLGRASLVGSPELVWLLGRITRSTPAFRPPLWGFIGCQRVYPVHTFHAIAFG